VRGARDEDPARLARVDVGLDPRELLRRQTALEEGDDRVLVEVVVVQSQLFWL
jgi:hypothetical protein